MRLGKVKRIVETQVPSAAGLFPKKGWPQGEVADKIIAALFDMELALAQALHEREAMDCFYAGVEIIARKK